jgi:chromosome segregation ATPase
MPDSRLPGRAPWGGQRNEGARNLKAEQDRQTVAALRQKIADLQARQKEAIHRLSTQTTSVEEVGVALAELENELKEAQEQLRRLLVGGTL